MNAYDPKDAPMPLEFFMRRYAISRTTCWRWRRAGLPTSQVGAKVFCRESDFVRFLEAGGKPQPQPEAKP